MILGVVVVSSMMMVLIVDGDDGDDGKLMVVIGGGMELGKFKVDSEYECWVIEMRLKFCEKVKFD